MDKTLSDVRFARYAVYLRTLYMQLEGLNILNSQMQGLRIPDSWFDGHDIISNHEQSVEDLETFFVVKDTLQETLQYSWELIKLTQPKVSNISFAIDAQNLRLASNAMVYKPGIHKVRISLVDYWAYKDGQTINKVRKPASASRTKLVGAEVVGAYALQDPQLLRLQDGIHLPHCKLTGLQQGHDFDNVPFFYWDFIQHRVCLVLRKSGAR